MSLHFNWSRLDETCAEALRQLLNKRLAEVVDRINSKGGGTDASSPTGTSNADAGSANTARNTNTAAASTPPAAFTGVPRTGKADPSANSSGHGSPLESHGGFSGATDLTGRPALLSLNPSSAGPNSHIGGGTSGSMPPTGPGQATAGYANALSVYTSTYPDGATSGTSRPSSEDGSGYPARSGGNGGGVHAGAALGRGAATFLGPSTTGGGGDVHGTGLNSVSRTNTAITGGTSVPAPLSCQRETEELAALSAEPRRVPPLVYLEVGTVEWGSNPPFIEIVAFDNAVDGPPGVSRPKPQDQASSPMSNAGCGAAHLGPDARNTSPFAMSHATSLESALASTSTTMTAPYPPTSGTGIGADIMIETGSESSHEFSSPRLPAPPVLSPRTALGGHVAGGETGMLTSSSQIGMQLSPSQQQRRPEMLSDSNLTSEPRVSDSLASVLGPGGLYIRFHITYGGALHLSLNTAVQHEIRLGGVSLRVSLPMLFYLANLDLDCYLCLNMRDNQCRVWLEHGPLSLSVVNRLTITASIGGDQDASGDGADFAASSADFYSRFGSSSVSDDEDGEEGNGVYVNEHEISQFVLHELRAILKETIVAPHCISIAVFF